MALLATKLYVPPVRPGLVARPRLVERLDAALDHRLTLLSAPAGFGKTTLLSQWVHAREEPLPVAWLSLDHGDNNPHRFWQYVVAALQTVDGSVGEALQAALHGPQLPPLQPLLLALINDLAGGSTPILFVLDDYHLIEAKEIHGGLDYVLDHLPPRLHLIIATRTDPPLHLPRRRGRTEMAEVRTADLRFTDGETAEYVNVVQGLGLADGDVAILARRTEGWAVGLQMAVISLEGQADRHEFVVDSDGDDRYVGDYLVQEVLQRQPVHVQSFLLRTSILERLCGPLCDAICSGAGAAPGEDGQSLLEGLERRNLFLVPLDHCRTWYRYHHLFADLLDRRLHRSMEGAEISRLHACASEWYEREGFIAEAISHALASGDVGRAARLIGRHAAAVWYRGEDVLVDEWLRALPEDVVRSGPLLCIRRAALALSRAARGGEPVLAEAEHWLHAAQAAWLDGPVGLDEPEMIDVFFSDVAAVHSALSAWRERQDDRFADFAREALDRLPREAAGLRATLLLILGDANWLLGDEEAALAAFAGARETGEATKSFFVGLGGVINRATAALVQGQLREAAGICRRALEVVVAPFEQADQPLSAAGLVHLLLGTVLAEWGELDEADRALRRGIELARLVDVPGPYQADWTGYESLVRLERCRGDAAGALAVIEQAERLGVGHSLWSAGLRARVRVHQAHEDARWLEDVARWAEEFQLSFDGVEYHDEKLTLARLLIARRRAWEASARSAREPDLRPLMGFLDARLAESERMGAARTVLELLIVKALAWQALGDAERALASLERALALGEPEGFALVFIDEGPPMAGLLRGAARRGIAVEYVGRLLEMCDRLGIRPRQVPVSPEPRPRSLVESLTRRELEVLALIARGLANAEIAQELVISISTVKRHVSNLYGKLGVTGRVQAMMAAREMGLLASSEGA